MWEINKNYLLLIYSSSFLLKAYTHIGIYARLWELLNSGLHRFLMKLFYHWQKKALLVSWDLCILCLSVICETESCYVCWTQSEQVIWIYSHHAPGSKYQNYGSAPRSPTCVLWASFCQQRPLWKHLFSFAAVQCNQAYTE